MCENEFKKEIVLDEFCKSLVLSFFNVSDSTHYHEKRKNDRKKKHRKEREKEEYVRDIKNIIKNNI